MFPELELDDLVQEELENEEKTEQGITYLYDFKKGDFVMKDGRLVIVEGKEGIKIWIEKLLLTEEFKFEIYKENNSENEYGTTIKRLIQGRKIPQLLLQSELKRIIEEKLVEHIEIDRVENFNTKQEMTTLIISFTVVLKDGDTFIQEVNF
ncbi:DUF2634 domain-containing protein [Tissierella creatinophila]|uniref:DUF2634 domain-containing protein n=1 Tax=Tissierella creatinophila DSM 6911 TaxID=1123403 RepID=A0A1U7M4J0_TISCR|nr:DUF2634 domain-containing protein [Tissierella creatinophila]OLS02234.1 hypothetical protein TICRE_17860 [Tissierella creatinophila DSM 6911]